MMATLGVALSLVPMALIPHWAAAGLSRLIFVVVSAVWLPACRPFRWSASIPEWRSIGYGAVAMAMGSGFGSTSIAGGYIVAAAGYRTLFALGIVLSLVAAGIMWGILRQAQPYVQGHTAAAPECSRVVIPGHLRLVSDDHVVKQAVTLQLP